MAQQPLVGKGLLIIEGSRLHAHTPHSVTFLWRNEQANAETYSWQHTTLSKCRHPTSPAGLEPAIPASERPQTRALESVATEIDTNVVVLGYVNK